MFYGCASVNGNSKTHVEERYVQQGSDKGLSDLDAVNVISGIFIDDFSLKITTSRPFQYNIVSSTDPFKKSVELKGVASGKFADKIIAGKEGIVEMSVQEKREPFITTVLDIKLSSPLEIFEQAGQNILEINLKAGGSELPSVDVQDLKHLAGRAGLSGNGAVERHANGNLKDAKFITGVSFKKESASRSKIEITGDGLIAPDVFILDGKIVIDIPKVKIIAPNKQSITAPLSALRWAEHKDKVRIVLDVAEKVSYEVITGGKVVDILLTAGPAAKTPKGAITVLPATKAGSRKGRHGAKEALTTDEILADVETKVRRLKDKKKEDDSGAKSTKKNLVTLDFNNADIVPIMRLISDVSGYNIVVDPGVRGKITLKLKDVAWDKALALILDTHNLDMEVDGNILKIRPKDSATGSDKCSAQPVVIKDLSITFSNIGGAARTIKRDNVESNSGNICLDLNINLDGDTSSKRGSGEKSDKPKDRIKH